MKKAGIFLLAIIISLGFFSGGIGVTSYAADTDNIAIYTKLNSSMQKIYNQVHEAILNCDSTLTIERRLTTEELENLAYLLYYYEPDAYNFKELKAGLRGGKMVLGFTYHYTKFGYEVRKTAIEKAVDNFVAKIPSSLSQYKKIQYVHDEIIKNTAYNLKAPDSFNPYGVLVLKEGKCDGYAKSFSMIMSKLGIETAIVLGNYTNDGDLAHVWNKVRYNGKWYNVDATYDDPISSAKNNMKHTYFMVSDKTLSRSHSELVIVGDFSYPVATDDSLAYYKQSNLYFDNYGSSRNSIANAVLRATKRNENAVSFQYSTKAEYDKAVKALFEKKELNTILSATNGHTENKVSDTVYFKALNNNHYVVTIYFFYPNTSISEYYVNPSKVSSANKKALTSIGVK